MRRGNTSLTHSNLTDIDLATMDDIDKELKKKKKEMRINNKAYNMSLQTSNVNNNNESNSHNHRHRRTTMNDNKKRSMILEIAKKAAQNGIKLNGFGKTKTIDVRKEHFKKEISKIKKNKSDSSSDYESTHGKNKKKSKSELDSDSEQKYQKDTLIIKPTKKEKSSDFLYKLPPFMNKIKKFELINYKIPETHKINFSNNVELDITVSNGDDKKENIHINFPYQEEKKFSEILTIVRDTLNKYSIDIYEENGLYVIEHTKDLKMIIENEMESILSIFGFDKSEYSNKSKYVATRPVNNNFAYLFLYKISNGSFAKLKEGNHHCEIVKEFDNPTKMEYLLLRLRTGNSEADPLCKFDEEMPELTFEFTFV